MLEQKIMWVIQDALEGSRKVKITFKPGASTDDVNYLLWMKRQRLIRMMQKDEVALLEVATRRDWKEDERVIAIAFTDKFVREKINAKLFIGKIGAALEDIEGLE